MTLVDTLQLAAENARRASMEQVTPTVENPEYRPQPALIGHCWLTATELSTELQKRRIPFEPRRGYIAIDMVVNSDLGGRLSDVDITEYTDGETGAVAPELWDEIGRPDDTEIPNRSEHYWVAVDGAEIDHFDTDETYHVEVASEARKHYGEIVVHTGDPDEYFYWSAESNRNVSFGVTP